MDEERSELIPDLQACENLVDAAQATCTCSQDTFITPLTTCSTCMTTNLVTDAATDLTRKSDPPASAGVRSNVNGRRERPRGAEKDGRSGEGARGTDYKTAMRVGSMSPSLWPHTILVVPLSSKALTDEPGVMVSSTTAG